MHQSKFHNPKSKILFSFRLASVFSVVFLSFTLCHAQTELAWIKTYGGESRDECYDHIQTSDGGYALVGTTWSFGNGRLDIWLLKTDENGDSLWSKTYGDWNREMGQKIFQTEDDGYIIIGSTNITGGDDSENFNALIMKVDENGDSLWAKVYGGERRDEIYTAVKTDEGYALAGKTKSYGNGNYDMWLLMVDEDGDSLWSKNYGGYGVQICNDLIVDPSGGFVLAGHTNNIQNSPDSYLAVFTNEDGDSLWSYSHSSGRYDYDRCFTIDKINDEVYVLSGSSEEAGSDMNILTLAFNNNGETMWTRFDGRDSIYINERIYTSTISKGGIVYTGYFDGQLGLIKYLNNGEKVHEEFFKADKQVLCYSILENESGNISLAGYYGDYNHQTQELEQEFMLVEIEGQLHVSDAGKYTITPNYSILYPSYPNPFNSHLSIDLNASLPVQVSVYDPLGRVVKSGRYNQRYINLSFNDSRLPTGTYFLYINDGRQDHVQRLTLLR